MSKPTILTVDDDPQVSQAITRDLRARYGADYRIVRATSGAEALDVLAELALRDASGGADRLRPADAGDDRHRAAGAARAPTAPDAKLLLLTAYADTDVAIRAINDIGLDYYLLKPWDPPEERLYPVIDDLLDDWQHANPSRDSEVRVVGHRWSERSHEIKTFLARNHVPYRWLDVERDAEGAPAASTWPRPRTADLPLVLVPEARPCGARPTLRAGRRARAAHAAPSSRSTTCASSAADRPGWPPPSTPRPRGCAPSSSSARRPAARPARAPRSRTTSASPRACPGSDLTQRAVAQASRFGAEMVLARDVVGFEQRGPVRAVLLGDAGEIEARAVLVATGVSYRHARGARASHELTGAASTTAPRPARPCQCAGRRGVRRGRGQLGRPGRAEPRQATPGGWSCSCAAAASRTGMSQYLVERITEAPNIEVRLHSEVASARGEGHLERITLGDRETGAERGGAPRPGCSSSSGPRRAPTGWARTSPATARASSITGHDLLAPDVAPRWPLERAAVRPGDQRARACSPPATCAWTR